MTRILNVISSPRGGDSNSTKLANAIVAQLCNIYPGASVKQRDLARDHLPHLSSTHLGAFFTPVEQHTDTLKASIRYSDEAIAELMAADVIVIAAPMYNFAPTSTLKAWLDQISRAGVTFRYTADGPEGLVTGKKIYLAITTGGIYSEAPGLAYDFLTPYLKHVLSFMGMTDITVVRGEGFAIPHLQQNALEKAIDSIALQPASVS
ncbi:FMN-dependent NADH-azoreductase [Parapedobacter composti]|uniref:FMN dependent NADH:quinone oxidoreductase n=1 Tax=Parapedobacter composti TaxID=623281 RepID=A0A1I1M132_9SPHI|nr:NAD(P)H-dependent oxidoreductase [Parapedobacter composti]SFC75370.1 FMN-dependent NADH-azoreductase [Parapedobacter composti]